MEYKRLLKKGMYGDDVLYVKEELLKLKYLSKVTHNKFGIDTKNAVKKFQSDNGLVPDGIVGIKTWNKLFNKEPIKPIEPIILPSHISKKVADAIIADLSKVSEIRKKVCLEALQYAVDSTNKPQAMKAFYIRGGNLYNTNLKLNVMSLAALKSYFNKTAYAEYFDNGRDKLMLEMAEASGYTIPGADCSGTVVGIWRKLKIKIPTFDANANSLYNNYCVPTSNPIPGDLAWRSGHIGIYVGGNWIVENVGGAYGLQITNATSRKPYNFSDKKLHTFSKWTAFGDPKVY